MPDSLADRMTEAVLEAYLDCARLGISAPWAKLGLGERCGYVRLTVEDVARICARVAREETVDA